MILCRLETIFYETDEGDYQQYLFDSRVQETLAEEELEQARFEENLAEADMMEAEVKHIISKGESV